LQLWDTAGQEKYKSVTRSYYKNSNGALAVYDITDRESLTLVETLITYYKNESESSMPMNIVLVGNKYDMATKHRQVSLEEGQRVAEHYNIPFYEISAKKNINVDEVFFEVAM
jgi:small GTP-binding protein